MTVMVTDISSCRICGSGDIYPFLNLGKMPLPNGFLNETEINESQPLFPLEVGVCTTCGLVQLTKIVNPEIMFRNYVYIPSASESRIRNFRYIVDEALNLVSYNTNSLAVDIGSNDGSLLLEFKKKGIRTLGVDPAENLSLVAELKGIEMINDYFSPTIARNIIDMYGSVTYVTATNVLAHIDNLHAFFDGIKILIDKTGIFICEFPYLIDLLEKKYFDTIYQEHLSYFSVGPLNRIINNHDLVIIRLQKTPIDGGALRLIITSHDSPFIKDHYAVKEILDFERKRKIDRVSTYNKFAREIKQLKKEIHSVLRNIRKEGNHIAGYGASARGNILMNYCDLGRKEIDFIVDSTPYKQGLYTPGTKILIHPEEEIMNRKPDYVLLLAWNFAKEIMIKQSDYKKEGGKFIIPVPEVKIIE